MSFNVITPFPAMFDNVLNESILLKAKQKNIAEYNIFNLFNYLDNSSERIDDYPFGGGEGMILKAKPISDAVKDIKSVVGNDSKHRVIFPTPDGQVFNHSKAKELSKESSLIFICGHYKGIDQRIRDEIVTDEISIGDFVLTSGELPAMIMIDSIIRLKKGVLNNYESAKKDSFYNLLLDGPHYTRPREFEGNNVPDVLLSGNHKKIKDWFLNQREEKTKKLRLDLWKKYKSKKME
ncbi:MAG: tRNA (guanosine(37)-N1)-methyltransferase TrmD [Candidatus Marinimicrobia bacterium]|nr:tRNA (guanosine(37)-N1)-methyltransferase TrmD [Candidatus Neomarinimicrobiota bacterium]